MTNDMQAWLRNTADILRKQWGLSDSFSDRAALLLAYFFIYGLSPRITSGYRSEEYQQELARRYASGDRSVIVKPATNSLHSTTTWLGGPAARAIDVSTSNPNVAGQIARALRVGAGLYFKTPDPVHFYQE